MPDWNTISQAVKTAGKFAAEHHETIAQGAQMGLDAKAKKNKEKDAKKSFQDYLLWKNKGQPDIEEFAYERAEVSGRTWTEIADNIRFHMNRRGESPAPRQSPTPAPAPVSQIASQPESPKVQEPEPQKVQGVEQILEVAMQPTKGIELLSDIKDKVVSTVTGKEEYTSIVDSLFSNQGKEIPEDFPDDERQWVRYICGYQDISECLGYDVVIESDMPKEDIRKLADLLGEYASYGDYVSKDLLAIAESEDKTLRDFPIPMMGYLRQGIAKFIFKKFIPKDELINFYLYTSDASFQIIRDKTYRALLVAYNEEGK